MRSTSSLRVSVGFFAGMTTAGIVLWDGVGFAAIVIEAAGDRKASMSNVMQWQR